MGTRSPISAALAWSSLFGFVACGEPAPTGPTGGQGGVAGQAGAAGQGGQPTGGQGGVAGQAGGQGGGAGQGGGGQAGSGGEPGCSSPDDCPGTGTTCAPKTCDEGECGTGSAPVLTPCSDDGGDHCDGGGSCVASTGDHLWSKSFGDGTVQPGRAAIDSLGNVVLTGAFGGTIDFGGGPQTADTESAFVVELDPSGQHLWSKVFASSATSTHRTSDVAVDVAGDLVVAGQYLDGIDLGGGPLASGGGSDFFLAKLDASGNHKWSHGFGGTGTEAGALVALGKNGDIVLGGAMGSSTDFGGGPLASKSPADIFLAKFDPSGSHLFSKRYSGAGLHRIFGLGADSEGNLVVLSQMVPYANKTAVVDFGAGALSEAKVGALVVAKLGADGVALWSKKLALTSAPDPSPTGGVAIAASGRVAIAGAFSGSIDFGGGPLEAPQLNAFVAVLDATGQHLWSKRFGEATAVPGAEARATAIAADAAGNLLLTGGFVGTIDCGGGALVSEGSANASDVFFCKLDAAGNHLWSKRFGDGEAQRGAAVAVSAAGESLLCGTFLGTIDLGGPTLSVANPSLSSGDLFVGLLAP